MIGMFRVGSVVSEKQTQKWLWKTKVSKYISFAFERDDNIFELASFTGIYIKFISFWKCEA